MASSGDIAAASAAALTPLDRLVALQDAAAGRPLSQLTLRLDGPQGVEERIRVDLRGNTVGATLDLGDRASVEQITSRLGELRQSLAQRGLDSESLLVRQRAGASDGGDVARLVAATLGDRDVARASGGATFAQQQSQQQSQQHTGQQGAQQHSSPRDRDGRAPHDPTHDPAYDPTSHEDASSRHRSRREPKGEQR